MTGKEQKAAVKLLDSFARAAGQGVPARCTSFSLKQLDETDSDSLVASVNVVRRTSTLCFLEGTLNDDGRPVFSASAIYKIG